MYNKVKENRHMDMREPIPGENPIEAAKLPKNERGNKHQWRQKLGWEASLTRIERDGRRTELAPSKKAEIAKVISEMPNIPENLRTVIEEWSDNLFALEHVRNRGYQKYLNSDNSLYQIWGAAALLAEKVDAAKSKNRDLTTEEMKKVENAFLKAANSRRKDGDIYMSQGDEIEELSKGISTLAKIIRRLK